MKKSFISLIHQPKKIIPIFLGIAIIVGAIAYKHVGTTPVVTLNSDRSTPNEILTNTSDNATNLAFPKNGRVANVYVKVGDSVTVGETLASLDAGDALGVVNQAKGALELAQAQYASLNSQYATTKAQQDTLVKNAYQTLLSSALEATPDRQDSTTSVISGTYTCGKEGSYILKPYASHDSDSGYSLNYSGLETGIIGVKYDSPVALGMCGLQIKFNHTENFNPLTVWTIAIPNTKSSVYLANKNAYDAAIANREKILTDLSTSIAGDAGQLGVAKAQINAAEGAYEAALGAYKNNLIVAPIAGVISFVDSDLKVGQSVTANKAVITITKK